MGKLKSISTRAKPAGDQIIMESSWHDIWAEDMPPVDMKSLQSCDGSVYSQDVVILWLADGTPDPIYQTTIGYFNFNERSWRVSPSDDYEPCVMINWTPRYWHVLPPLPRIEIDQESEENTP